MTLRKVLGLALVGGLMLIAGTPARAEFSPDFQQVVPVGPNFSFQYELDFAADPTGSTFEARIDNGDFVTITDFFGPIISVTVPAGFSFSVQSVGITPTDLVAIPGDSPNLFNVTFIRTGGTVTTPQSFGDEGGFQVVVTTGLTTLERYASEYTTNTGPEDGQTITELGTTTVNAVPEPSSLALVALGLGGLGLVARARRNRKVTA